MKNITLNIILALMLTTAASNASDKIHVSSLSDFSTAEPAETLNVKVIENVELGKYNLYEGDVIHCSITDVSGPKRGKRSAGFKVVPVYYVHEGEHITIDDAPVGKYAKTIISKEELKNVDKRKVGKKAALSVGNHFIKGVAPVAALAEGMIKNEDGNRLTSGVKQVYKSSPVSYIEKGKDIELHAGDIFYLVFKNSENDEATDITEGTEEE